MKINQSFVPLAALCVITALVGCASTNRQVFANMLLPEFSQPVNLSQPEFQKPDPDTNKPVTLDDRQQLDTTVGARENFSALDETGDGQINLTEFLKHITKHSKRYHFFAGADTVNDGYVSWDKELFRQPGWQLFSIRF